MLEKRYLQSSGRSSADIKWINCSANWTISNSFERTAITVSFAAITTIANSHMHVNFAWLGIHFDGYYPINPGEIILPYVKGIWLISSTDTVIEIVTIVSEGDEVLATLSEAAGIVAEFSIETVLTNVTIRGQAPFPLVFETSNNTFIENLTLLPGSIFIEIQFILSNYITLRSVDVYYPTTHKGLRLLIGSTSEVFISLLHIDLQLITFEPGS